MSAYKYTLYTGYNPFIQALVKPRMGKNYTYNGRLYCQVKKQGNISYADSSYNLNVKLVSWTADSIDVELEIRGFKVTSDYDILTSQCKPIINIAASLDNIPLSVRINSKGRIQQIFNIVDVANACQLDPNNEKALIEKLETNPLLSAFISGQIDNQKTSKVFASNIFEDLNITSKLEIGSKKEKFKKTTEIYVVDQSIDCNIQNEISGSEKYDFTTAIASSKGIGRVLSYSIDYSTEETLGPDHSVFISIGLQKVVLDKDISLCTKLYSTLLKNISAIF